MPKPFKENLKVIYEILLSSKNKITWEYWTNFDKKKLGLTLTEVNNLKNSEGD